MPPINPQIPDLKEPDYLRFSRAYEAPFVSHRQGQEANQILPRQTEYEGPRYQGLTHIDESGKYAGVAQGLRAQGQGSAIEGLAELGDLASHEVLKTKQNVVKKKAETSADEWQNKW